MTGGPSVLITGACGFLGKSTLRLFLGSSFDVYALDLPGTHHSLPSDLIGHKNLKVIEADLNDESLQSTIPASLDYVIHLAGLASVRDSIEHPIDYETANVGGTVHLLNALSSQNIRKFVFSSSASVYGFLSSEDLEETDPVDPMNPYGKSKLASEQEVLALGKKYGLNTLILRFFNVYGPEKSLVAPGIVNSFIKSIITEDRVLIIGDGSRTRSFIHVRDCARALMLGCTADTAGGTVINICSPESISIKEVAEIIVACSGKSNIIFEYEESDFTMLQKSGCTGRCALELLAFSPIIEIHEGIRETYQYHKNRLSLH